MNTKHATILLIFLVFAGIASAGNPGFPTKAARDNAKAACLFQQSGCGTFEFVIPEGCENPGSCQIGYGGDCVFKPSAKGSGCSAGIDPATCNGAVDGKFAIGGGACDFSRGTCDGATQTCYLQGCTDNDKDGYANCGKNNTYIGSTCPQNDYECSKARQKYFDANSTTVTKTFGTKPDDATASVTTYTPASGPDNDCDDQDPNTQNIYNATLGEVGFTLDYYDPINFRKNTLRDKKFSPSPPYTPYDNIALILQLPKHKDCEVRWNATDTNLSVIANGKTIHKFTQIQIDHLIPTKETDTPEQRAKNPWAIILKGDPTGIVPELEDLIDAIGNRNTNITFRLEQKNPKTSQNEAKDIQAPMTNCVQLQGNGPHNMVSMRIGSVGKYNPTPAIVPTGNLKSQTLGTVALLNNVDPFRIYENKFTYLLDLYNHDGMKLPGKFKRQEIANVSAPRLKEGENTTLTVTNGDVYLGYYINKFIPRVQVKITVHKLVPGQPDNTEATYEFTSPFNEVIAHYKGKLTRTINDNLTIEVAPPNTPFAGGASAEQFGFSLALFENKYYYELDHAKTVPKLKDVTSCKQKPASVYGVTLAEDFRAHAIDNAFFVQLTDDARVRVHENGHAFCDLSDEYLELSVLPISWNKLLEHTNCTYDLPQDYGYDGMLYGDTVWKGCKANKIIIASGEKDILRPSNTSFMGDHRIDPFKLNTVSCAFCMKAIDAGKDIHSYFPICNDLDTIKPDCTQTAGLTCPNDYACDAQSKLCKKTA